jgi:hypothetical protein
MINPGRSFSLSKCSFDNIEGRIRWYGSLCPTAAAWVASIKALVGVEVCRVEPDASDAEGCRSNRIPGFKTCAERSGSPPFGKPLARAKLGRLAQNQTREQKWDRLQVHENQHHQGHER